MENVFDNNHFVACCCIFTKLSASNKYNIISTEQSKIYIRKSKIYHFNITKLCQTKASTISVKLINLIVKTHSHLERNLENCEFIIDVYTWQCLFKNGFSPTE